MGLSLRRCVCVGLCRYIPTQAIVISRVEQEELSSVNASFQVSTTPIAHSCCAR